MPIYSPTGFLDITNATLRTSNLEAQNFKLNGGNIYVTSELTTDELLNLDNVVNAGNATSNTVQFTNLTTGLVADSNIIVTGNVTAGSFLGDGSGLTSIPPSAITGTLSQWSDGTNSDVYIASNVGIGNVHTLTSNTLQVGANLYVRDADANVLTVTGNVAADYFEGDGSKLTGISSNLEQIANNGNVTSNTVQFTNATTGFVTTSNIEVGGALKINTITAAAYHSLQAVTNVGNVTSNTVQFSNATTGLVTTGNVEVGRDLSVTGNLTVLGTRTIVDTDTLRVKDPIIELGKDNPGTGDLGLVMTRPSGSSNVGIIFDESESTLEIGYTQSNASDTDITMRTAATEPLDVNVNGNVSVGKELTVTGNVAVDTDTLFVDSVNDRVGIGKTDPGATLDVVGDVELNDRLTINSSVGNITKKSFTSYSASGLTRYWKVASGNYDGNRRNHIKMTVNIHRIDTTNSTRRLVMEADTGSLIFHPCIDEHDTRTPSYPRDLRVYKNTSDTTFDIYIQVSSYSYVDVEMMYSGNSITVYDTPTWESSEPTTSGTYLLEFTNGNLNAMKIDNDGNVGIGTTDPKSTLHINSTDSIIIPVGTDAQRSGTPVDGMLRYNSTQNAVEYYYNNWVQLSPRIGTQIVLNGLVAQLDASDYSSYTGSGSTWYDISGNGRNGTLRGSVSWVNNGWASYFDFPGQNADYVDQTTGTSQIYKDICIVFNVDGMSSSFAYLISKSTTTDASLRIGANNIGNPGNTGDWSDNVGSNGITYYVNGVADTDNVPITNGEWYILGGENTNNVLLAAPWNYYLGTGYTQGSRNLNGKIAFVALYNRVLTASEQLQNYNALKARFGV